VGFLNEGEKEKSTRGWSGSPFLIPMRAFYGTFFSLRYGIWYVWCCGETVTWELQLEVLDTMDLIAFQQSYKLEYLELSTFLVYAYRLRIMKSR
jgi:hypothetical protein